MVRIGVLLMALCAALPVSAAPGEFQDDLEARRARIMEELGPAAMLILWSAPVRTYSHDIEFEYRQDSNLYYLTGIEQQGTILVLMPGNETRKAILFIKKKDPVREHWQGHMLSKQEATDLSGIDTVYSESEFDAFLSAILSKQPYDVPRYEKSSEYQSFFEALRDGDARLSVVSGRARNVKDEVPPPLQFARELKDRFLDFTIQDATEILSAARQVKTPYEMKLLEQSGEIASQGQMAGMRAARPGAFEYEVEAVIEATYKRLGAYGPSYPSIVASGPNANILHYSESKRLMEPGDLLLVDSAAHYKYLTIDITRTYPVNGTFTPLQKGIYGLVLAAQNAGIQKAREKGVTLDDIQLETVEVMKKGLLERGLITDTSGEQYKIWYTHGACHWIGMDVHDVGIRKRSLEPGMAFVIEPGLYIREAALENLPDTAENRELIEKVRPAVEKYKDIGIRIEDSFLLTDSGLKRLSAKVPRTIEEIERYLASPSTTDSSR